MEDFCLTQSVQDDMERYGTGMRVVNYDFNLPSIMQFK